MNDPKKRGELTIALALLGVVLFSKPILDGFDAARETFLLGIPSLYLYLFLAWGLLVLLLALVVESAGDGLTGRLGRNDGPDSD